MALVGTRKVFVMFIVANSVRIIVDKLFRVNEKDRRILTADQRLSSDLDRYCCTVFLVTTSSNGYCK